jgi:hypothetical protein
MLIGISVWTNSQSVLQYHGVLYIAKTMDMEGVNQGLLDAARSGDIEKLQVAACVLVRIGLSHCTLAIRERKWPSLGCRVRSGWGPT